MSSIVKAKLLTYAPIAPVVADGAEAESECEAAVPEEPNMAEAHEGEETFLRQALKKAKHIENEAQLKANSIMENAMKSSREIMEEAEKKGYEEGYLRGLVDGAHASELAAEEGLLELKRLIDLFRTDQKEALERDEKDLMELAFELAGKIMKQHVQADENAVQKMLEEIVLENEGSFKIYFSEYQETLDIHIDKATAKKLRNLTKDAKLVVIQGQDLILSENENGIVDMSVPVQLAQLKKAVDRMIR